MTGREVWRVVKERERERIVRGQRRGEGGEMGVVTATSQRGSPPILRRLFWAWWRREVESTLEDVCPIFYRPQSEMYLQVDVKYDVSKEEGGESLLTDARSGTGTGRAGLEGLYHT